MNSCSRYIIIIVLFSFHCRCSRFRFERLSYSNDFLISSMTYWNENVAANFPLQPKLQLSVRIDALARATSWEVLSPRSACLWMVLDMESSNAMIWSWTDWHYRGKCSTRDDTLWSVEARALKSWVVRHFPRLTISRFTFLKKRKSWEFKKHRTGLRVCNRVRFW
jgi:hypothetical protein